MALIPSYSHSTRVLIYMRTPCGLRIVVTILENITELLGDTFGKPPCYNSVENLVKKLGLYVHQDDRPCKYKNLAMVVDKSIAINGQKLLLTFGIYLPSIKGIP